MICLTFSLLAKLTNLKKYFFGLLFHCLLLLLIYYFQIGNVNNRIKKLLNQWSNLIPEQSVIHFHWTLINMLLPDLPISISELMSGEWSVNQLEHHFYLRQMKRNSRIHCPFSNWYKDIYSCINPTTVAIINNWANLQHKLNNNSTYSFNKIYLSFTILYTYNIRA